MVQAAKEILRADEGTVSYLLGGITVGTAVVGTLGGGKPTPSTCFPFQQGTQNVFSMTEALVHLSCAWQSTLRWMERKSTAVQC